ncbi:hypothetical protein D3C87_2092370 [compost metagenome]
MSSSISIKLTPAKLSGNAILEIDLSDIFTFTNSPVPVKGALKMNKVPFSSSMQSAL